MQNNGYILKFYKKLKTLNHGNDSFHFVSFMNFDGIRIIPVKSFKEYQRSTINFKTPCDNDQDCSRQKLLIYNFNKEFSNLHEEEYIFDRDNSTFSKDYPILAITIINLKRGTNYEDVINNTKSILDTKNIKYKFFGSLSINDLVIVYRCKNFSDLFECNYYSLFPRSDLFHSTYTIPCLLLPCAKHWVESPGLEISIRSSIPPKDTYYNNPSNSKLSINGKSILGLKRITKYDVFGKYDIDVRGTIDSSEKFIENFSKGLFFEKDDEQNHIKRNTNTRFLYRCSSENSENIHYAPDVINENINKFKDDISQLCSEIISGSQSNSSDYNHNLARLWLRAYQLLLRGRDNPILDDIIDIVKSYFTLVNEYVNNLDYSESIITGLKSLNTLIDNRDLNDFYEFENPHSNLMFSGCCTSLLSAYSNMANRAFKAIAKLNNESKNYLAYITSDGYAEVSAKQLFTGNNQCFLINIRIPTELMFDFKNLVCFILHEIGHNWNFLNLRKHIFLKIFLNILSTLYFQNENRNYGLLPKEVIKDIISYAINEKSMHSSEFIDITDTLAVSFLEHNVCNNVFESYENARIITQNFKKLFSATEEAKSDIFMIKFIGVKSPDFYLNVVVDYLNYKNINYEHIEKIDNDNNIEENYKEIMDSMFVRVLVVLIFLLAEKGKNSKEVLVVVMDALKKYLSKAQTQYENDFNKTVTKTRKDFVSQLISSLDEGEDLPTVFLYAYQIYSRVLCPSDIERTNFRKKFNFKEDKGSLEMQENFGKYLNKGNDELGFKEIINFINSINLH